MERCDRPDKPKSAPEKVMLEAFLDFHRATLLCKLDGLGDEALRRPGTPSGVTLLGIVKHLTYVERDWIRARFPGEELPPDQIRPADDAEWRIEPDEATAAILAGYRDEHERCRVVVAGAEPDDIARRPDYRAREFSLRWILLHLIEETARHNGHADVLREAIDGQTGE